MNISIKDRNGTELNLGDTISGTIFYEIDEPYGGTSTERANEVGTLIFNKETYRFCIRQHSHGRMIDLSEFDQIIRLK